MSVKSKVKRCNKEIERLELKVEDLEIQNDNLRKNILKQDDNSEKTKIYSNIVKFALTNHIGGLNAVMKIERNEIDKMQDLKLNVEYDPMFNSYIMRVHY